MSITGVKYTREKRTERMFELVSADISNHSHAPFLAVYSENRESAIIVTGRQ